VWFTRIYFSLEIRLKPQLCTPSTRTTTVLRYLCLLFLLVGWVFLCFFDFLDFVFFEAAAGCRAAPADFAAAGEAVNKNNADARIATPFQTLLIRILPRAPSSSAA
jgi:hypothetical protein